MLASCLRAQCCATGEGGGLGAGEGGGEGDVSRIKSTHTENTCEATLF